MYLRRTREGDLTVDSGIMTAKVDEIGYITRGSTLGGSRR
jgi:hypothetical protein